MKKTVELAAPIDASSLKDGVELIVRVPLSAFDDSWEGLGQHLEREYLEPEMPEEELRLLCAAFYAVRDSLTPMLTSDLTAWLLRTGCPGNVWEVVKNYFGVDELRADLAL